MAAQGDADIMKTALMLMRRTDPAALEDNAEALSALLDEDIADEFMQRVDLPLQVMKDTSAGKDFLASEFNADGDAYRSPWSNKFYPKEDASPDSEPLDGKLRKLEEYANEVFDVYRQHYYDRSNSVSSAIVWGTDDGFAAAFLLQHKAGQRAHVKSGSWEATHVVGASKQAGGKYQVQLTTTVSLAMDVQSPDMGDSRLGGSLTRQGTKTAVMDPADAASVMAVLGPMMEEMEGSIRNSLDRVYLTRNRTIVQMIRNGGDAQFEKSFVKELSSAVAAAAL